MIQEKGAGPVRADYHVHTSFSDDSETLMEEAVLHAIAVGLDEIDRKSTRLNSSH